MIALLVFLSSKNTLHQTRDLDCLELFAGHGMVARMFRSIVAFASGPSANPTKTSIRI
jgi:hypothetical protein